MFSDDWYKKNWSALRAGLLAPIFGLGTLRFLSEAGRFQFDFGGLAPFDFFARLVAWAETKGFVEIVETAEEGGSLYGFLCRLVDKEKPPDDEDEEEGVGRKKHLRHRVSIESSTYRRRLARIDQVFGDRPFTINDLIAQCPELFEGREQGSLAGHFLIKAEKLGHVKKSRNLWQRGHDHDGNVLEEDTESSGIVVKENGNGDDPGLTRIEDMEAVARQLLMILEEGKIYSAADIKQLHAFNQYSRAAIGQLLKYMFDRDLLDWIMQPGGKMYRLSRIGLRKKKTFVVPVVAVVVDRKEELKIQAEAPVVVAPKPVRKEEVVEQKPQTTEERLKTLFKITRGGSFMTKEIRHEDLGFGLSERQYLRNLLANSVGSVFAVEGAGMNRTYNWRETWLTNRWREEFGFVAVEASTKVAETVVEETKTQEPARTAIEPTEVVQDVVVEPVAEETESVKVQTKPIISEEMMDTLGRIFMPTFTRDDLIEIVRHEVRVGMREELVPLREELQGFRHTVEV